MHEQARKASSNGEGQVTPDGVTGSTPGSGPGDWGSNPRLGAEERIIRILALLHYVWQRHPDWRLGQLVSNLKGVGPQDVFYMEDDFVADRLLNIMNDLDEGRNPWRADQ